MFRAKLLKIPGAGGWTFALIPPRFAPLVTAGWGRTPVWATADGQTWATSVWRDKKRGTMLPVPKKIRGAKSHDDTMKIQLRPR